MNIKRLFLLAVVCVMAAGTAMAAAKTKKKNNIKLVTAYAKTIPEDQQTSPAMEGTFIVVRWDAATYPETMFWRGKSGWFTCNIEKAVKVKGKKNEYTAEFVQMDQIKKGDTLMVTPIKGGKYAIPSEIPPKATNTIFYKTAGNSTWQSFTVSPISKK